MAHGGGNRPNAGRKPGSATKKNPARSRTKRACGPLVYLNSLAAGCSAGSRPLATSDRVQDVCCRFLR